MDISPRRGRLAAPVMYGPDGKVIHDPAHAAELVPVHPDAPGKRGAGAGHGAPKGERRGLLAHVEGVQSQLHERHKQLHDEHRKRIAEHKQKAAHKRVPGYRLPY